MKKTTFALLVIISAAFILRLALAMNADRFLTATLGGERSFTPDSVSYVDHALNILHGRGYGFGSPTVTHGWFQAPGYSYFIFLIYKFIGQSLMAVRIAQAILDSLTIAIIFLIARQIFTIRVALVSGILYAIYPYFILQSLYITSECLVTFLYAVTVLLILKILAQTSRSIDLIFASLFLAASSLTRTTVAALLPFLAAWLLFSFHKQRLVLKRLLIVFLIFCCMLAPWVISTYIQTGRLIPISTTGIVILWIGNSEYGPLYIFDPSARAPAVAGGSLGMSPSGVHDGAPSIGGGLHKECDAKLRERFLKEFYTRDDPVWFMKEIKKCIIQSPVLVLKMKYRNFVNFWRIMPKTAGCSLSRIFVNFLSVSVIPVLGILGLLRAHRLRDIRVHFFYFSFLLFTAIHVASFAIVRYRATLIDPYLIIFASYFVIDVIAAKKQLPAQE